ncbi:retrovirus-related pol polyprotein from transposon TNT 1-94 [Tanacetum coccineum]
MKAKLALLEASPLSFQNPKYFQPKNKGLVAKTFDWDEEEVSDEEEVNRSSEQIPHQKKKVLGGELLTESSSKMNENENLFVPASMGILYCMICKMEDHRTSDHEMYIASLKRSENYKAQPYQYASSSKQILKAKAKPFPSCTHCGFNDHRPDDYRNYPECEICGSYDHSTSRHNRVIQIRGGVLAESSQSNDSSIGVKCNTRRSTVHSTFDHNEFDHFKRGEKFQARHIREPIWYLDSGWSRSMTGVKSYLHKYVKQPGPKFNDKQGTIFNANKEIVLISPRRNDVYVLDMSSLTLNWLCHKRLSHLNFKNINKVAKQNKVLGLPSLVYSKDKPYTSCEKGKHHRASFKTKQNFSIRMCLHLLHMDLFRPDGRKPNDVKVKQIRTNNGTEFRNHELESFCDEKGISQNFSSPYTPEQNGVAEKKNKILIEAARTMLNKSVLSKHFWTDVDIPLSQRLSESITQEDNK